MCILPHKKYQIRTFSNIKILYEHKNALEILYATIISHSQKALFSDVKDIYVISMDRPIVPWNLAECVSACPAGLHCGQTCHS